MHLKAFGRSAVDILGALPDRRGRAVARACIALYRNPTVEWSRNIEIRREVLESSNVAFEETAVNVQPSNTLGEHARRASTNPNWCGFLYALVRALRPPSCLEMGSGVGISAAYISAALHENGCGGLLTLEGNPQSARIARETLRVVGLEREAEVVCGRFQETLEGALSSLGSVGFVFIDGHKDGQAMLGYFRQVLPRLSNESVVLFDDIGWSHEMSQAWRDIVGSFDARFTIDLGEKGVWAK